MNKTKNQHYIPQMYMKRFGYGPLKNRKISVLKKRESIVLDGQNVENFASKRFFYDTSKEKLEKYLEEIFQLHPGISTHINLDDPQFVEHALSREEAAINDLLNVLQNNLSAIRKESNMAKMIEFLHTMAYRTKSYRDTLEYINQKTIDVIGQMCDSLGLSNEVKESEIERLCQSGKDTQLQQIIEIAPVLQTMVFLTENYDWYEAYNNTDFDFVISDNPFQTIIMGFNDICVPISNSKALVLRVKDKDAQLISKDMPVNGKIQLSTKSVIAYNMLQLGMAQHYLFGTKASIAYMKRINDCIMDLTDLSPCGGEA